MGNLDYRNWYEEVTRNATEIREAVPLSMGTFRQLKVKNTTPPSIPKNHLQIAPKKNRRQSPLRSLSFPPPPHSTFLVLALAFPPFPFSFRPFRSVLHPLCLFPPLSSKEWAEARRRGGGGGN